MKPGVLFGWAAVGLFALATANAQIGRRFPSEEKIVPVPKSWLARTYPVKPGP